MKRPALDPVPPALLPYYRRAMADARRILQEQSDMKSVEALLVLRGLVRERIKRALKLGLRRIRRALWAGWVGSGIAWSAWLGFAGMRAFDVGSLSFFWGTDGLWWWVGLLVTTLPVVSG
ncbi:hypothetical protein GF324_09685, partial [bacterium]|nr:hypothetical protein [bacterium]